MAVVLSGGNVDAGLLADVTRRHETQAGRRLVLLARVPDRRGRSRGCSRSVAERGANLATSSTSARGSSCTCARRRCSSCSRHAASTTRERVIDAVRRAGYLEPLVLGTSGPSGRSRQRLAVASNSEPSDAAHERD